MPADHPSPGRPARPHHRGLAAAGPPPRPPLQRPRRTHRRPAPDRRRRPDQSRRQVRPRPRRRLRRLRHPHHHRRDSNATSATAPGTSASPAACRNCAWPSPKPTAPCCTPSAAPPPSPTSPPTSSSPRKKSSKASKAPAPTTPSPCPPRPATANAPPNSATLLGGEDHEYELAELRVALGPALATLDEREQKILTLRFYGNLTQSQIADQIGVSQMHVSRLLTRALTKLRGQLDETY